MVQSKSSLKLYELVETVINHFGDFYSMNDNEILNRQELYMHTKGTITNYDKGVQSTTWSSEPIIKEDTYWRNFVAYIERLNPKYPILKQCLEAIKNEFNLTDNEAQVSFNALIHFLLVKKKANLSEIQIIEIVTVFINDLNKSAPHCKVTLWIQGIWLNDELINISKEILIRKPVDSDFDFFQPAFTLASFTNPTVDSCDSIIEISTKFDNEMQAEDFINKTIQALRLFDLGAVKIKKREYELNSILTNYGMIYPPDVHSHYKYEIALEDAKLVEQFILYMMDFLPDKNWQNKNDKMNSIFIAIDRYCEAITRAFSTENRITTSITALEALLLKGNERSELSHKLSQRVAYLARYFNDQPIKIYNAMKRAYDIRSTYIHGSMLPPEERKDLADIQYQVVMTLRKVILVFIDLSKKFTKDEIIAKIDNAIIDSGAHDKLTLEIQKLKLLKYTSGNTGFIVTKESK